MDYWDASFVKYAGEVWDVGSFCPEAGEYELYQMYAPRDADGNYKVVRVHEDEVIPLDEKGQEITVTKCNCEKTLGYMPLMFPNVKP